LDQRRGHADVRSRKAQPRPLQSYPVNVKRTALAAEASPVRRKRLTSDHNCLGIWQQNGGKSRKNGCGSGQPTSDLHGPQLELMCCL
jgi:hypothetical protein